MKTMYGLMFGVALLAGVATSTAQQSSIPFEKIQLEASVTTQPNLSVGTTSPESYSSSLAETVPPLEAPGAGMMIAVAPVASHKILDRRYFLLNGLHMGLGLLDVALTQRCMAAHQCSEGNPLMPSSLAGQLSVNFAYVGYAAFFSYNLKKRHSRLWWISPSSGIATHTVGVATGLMH